jgi:hypothetical protein
VKNITNLKEYLKNELIKFINILIKSKESPMIDNQILKDFTGRIIEV